MTGHSERADSTVSWTQSTRQKALILTAQSSKDCVRQRSLLKGSNQNLRFADTVRGLDVNCRCRFVGIRTGNSREIATLIHIYYLNQWANKVKFSISHPHFIVRMTPQKKALGGFLMFQCFVFFLIFAFSCLDFSCFPLLFDFLKPSSGPSDEVIYAYSLSICLPFRVLWGTCLLFLCLVWNTLFCSVLEAVSEFCCCDLLWNNKNTLFCSVFGRGLSILLLWSSLEQQEQRKTTQGATRGRTRRRTPNKTKKGNKKQETQGCTTRRKKERTKNKRKDQQAKKENKEQQGERRLNNKKKERENKNKSKCQQAKKENKEEQGEIATIRKQNREQHAQEQEETKKILWNNKNTLFVVFLEGGSEFCCCDLLWNNKNKEKQHKEQPEEEQEEEEHQAEQKEAQGWTTRRKKEITKTKGKINKQRQKANNNKEKQGWTTRRNKERTNTKDQQTKKENKEQQGEITTRRKQNREQHAQEREEITKYVLFFRHSSCCFDFCCLLSSLFVFFPFSEASTRGALKHLVLLGYLYVSFWDKGSMRSPFVFFCVRLVFVFLTQTTGYTCSSCFAPASFCFAFRRGPVL